MRPEKATTGLRPKVLNSRLNQTTSGLSLCSVFRRRNTLLGSSNDQQRRILNPAGSAGFDESSSARTVRLRNGFRCNSCAMWNPYSLNPPVLGGNVVTRQIFIRLRLVSAQDSMSFQEKMLAVHGRKKQIQAFGIFASLAGQGVGGLGYAKSVRKHSWEMDSLISPVVSSGERGARTVMPRSRRLNVI